MKTTMKFFAALAIMMGFTVGAMAQSSKTGEVTAHATVQKKLEVTQTLSLEFGIVDKGQNKIVGVSGLATSDGGSSVSQTGVQTGVATIVRSGTVTYTLTPSADFLVGGSDGVSHLAFGNLTSAYVVGAAEPVDGSGGVLSTTVSAGFSEDIIVRIGATVSPDANTSIGNYTGTITLSAAYN